MIKITATHINLYHVCHRELWLHANEIRMEHTSDTVYDGKLIGENSYTQRAAKYTELALDGIKIDFYDAKNKVVHEVKRSNKVENAHLAQVKYYLYKLEQNGVEHPTGILEYPTLRQTQEVFLSDLDREQIPLWEQDIQRIISQTTCPPIEKKNICKSCSYHDFCFVTEPD